MTKISLTILALMLAISDAEASYLRLWRGTARPDLSSKQFVDGLNRSLFPATGRLAQTSARLRSYQPVILSSRLALKLGLPGEVALLEYADETSYRSYRETPEGKAYGDLHWDYFVKDASRSLVPERYPGKAEIEKAYDIVGSETDWYQGKAYFRVLERVASVSDADFLESVRERIENISRRRPKGLVVLVASKYVMEYSLWDEAVAGESSAVSALRVAMDIRLSTAAVAKAGGGIRYRLP